MRDIIFRAKGKYTGQWYYGDLFQARGEFATAIVKEGKTEMVEIDPETVGQYIGLEDRNGRKIFDGDLIGRENWEGKLVCAPVHYGEFNCSCCDGVYGWSFYPEDIRNPYFYVVGGNIHDNPELLEAEPNADEKV